MAEQEAETGGSGGQAGRFRLILWMAGVLPILLLAIVIAANIGEAGTRKALLDKILDWPVLGFSIAMMLFGALGREVLELIRTRNVKVGSFLEIGDKINAVEAETDEMGASLADRIKALEEAVYGGSDSSPRLSTVSTARPPPPNIGTGEVSPTSGEERPPSAPAPSAAPTLSSAPRPEPAPPPETLKATVRSGTDPVTDEWKADMEVFGLLLDSLRDSRFEWRSLERLAIENGLSEDEVMRLFRVYGQGVVRMGKGKSGRRIAKVVGRG